MFPRKKESASEAEARIRKRLSRYFLPQTDIENLPLDEALAALQATFYSVDQLGWGDSEAIAFKMADEDADTPSVSLSRSNISALSALHLLAMQSGHELSFSPPEILFKKKPDDAVAEEGGELYTRSFRMTYNRLGAGPYREFIMTPLGEIPVLEFLPALGRSFQQDDDLNRIALLQNTWGLQLSSDKASATMIEGNQLVLKSTNGDLDHFASLYAEATGANSNSSPVIISMKIFSIPSDLAVGGDRIIESDELQIIARQLAQQKGTDVLTAPKMFTRVGQEARAEMGSIPDGTSFEGAQAELRGDTLVLELDSKRTFIPDVHNSDPDLPIATGLSIPVTAHPAGEQITLIGQIDQAVNQKDLSAEQLEQFGGSDPDSSIVHFLTDFEVPLLPGQVALFECESPEPDKKHVIAVSVDWVGETSFKEISEE